MWFPLGKPLPDGRGSDGSLRISVPLRGATPWSPPHTRTPPVILKKHTIFHAHPSMKKLLALNRSEIAIRILRAANELGLRTVAIYSQEDRLALHRFKADEAYLIGEGKGPVEAYLDVEGIVALAKEKGVDAIHPGYGFLSENAALPRACERAGITFVGPAAELLELLGDKTRRAALAQKAGIPARAGHRGSRSPIPKQARRSRGEIGFPLIIKAAFGGGGRGMRVVRQARPISPSCWRKRGARRARVRQRCGVSGALRAARASTSKCRFWATSTATSCTCTSAIARCSGAIRRWSRLRPRWRSIRKIRARACEAAVTLARAAGYDNAGTVEFLVDADTGRVVLHRGESAHPGGAHGHRDGHRHRPGALPDSDRAGAAHLHGPEMSLPPQDQSAALRLRHAVPHHHRRSGEQLRAGLREDPHLPLARAGSASGWMAARRIAGAVITPFYDSLLVKITAWGREFRHACQRMDRALREFRMRGVKTNIPVPRKRRQPPGFPGGRRHDAVAGADAGAVPLRAAPGPRHQAADLSWRRDRQRQSARWPASPAPARIDPRRCRRTTRPAPPDGTRQLLRDARAGEIRRVDAGAEAPAAHRHHVSRRAPIAAGHARAHLRHAGASPTSSRTGCTISTAWKCGAARRSTSPCASCTKIRGVRLRRLREAIPNICFQMLLRASNAVGLYDLSGQRRSPSSSTRRPRRASTSSASSIR